MEHISKVVGGWINPRMNKETISLTEDDLFSVFFELRKKFPKKPKPHYLNNSVSSTRPQFYVRADWEFSDQTFANAAFAKFNLKFENITNLSIFWYSSGDQYQRACQINFNTPWTVPKVSLTEVTK